MTDDYNICIYLLRIGIFFPYFLERSNNMILGVVVAEEGGGGLELCLPQDALDGAGGVGENLPFPQQKPVQIMRKPPRALIKVCRNKKNQD